MFHIITIFLFLSSLSIKLWAAPYYDPNLLDLMQTEPHAEYPVLLMFDTELSLAKAKTRKDIMRSYQMDLDAKILELKQNYNWFSEKEIKRLWIVNGILINLNKQHLGSLIKVKNLKGAYYSQREIKQIKQEDKNQFLTLNRYTYGLEKINVKEIREKYPNLKGQGVRVGIIDTGINPNHQDLKDKMINYKDFSPNPNPKPGDGFDHGTHVAGTIAGGNTSGVAIGIAPEADLIIARIFDRNGSSTVAKILESMQWIADPDENPDTADHAQVINSSWSDDDPYNDRVPNEDPFCQAITTWLHLDIIPVFSAGNSGPREGTINIPGGCPQAFAVGATEQNDRSPHFSSTGPAVWLDLKINKPDVSAPGFKIISSSATGGYKKMSGTSMAAPHVTGAFAILLQAYPDEKPTNLIRAMSSGAKDLGKPEHDSVFGEGRIDLLKSIQIMAN